MRLRGVDDHYKMLLEIGFAPATVRRFLRNEHWRMDFENIEKLCLALNCTPNDLFEWRPKENLPHIEDKALLKLKRDANSDVSKMLGSLPIEKIEQIADIIQDLKDE